jgi:hypothetical protein
MYRKLLPVMGRIALAVFVILEVVWLVQNNKAPPQ